MRSRTRKFAGASVTVAAVAALLLLPAGAAGATASIDIKRVFYVAGPSEANDVTISLVGENYIVSDPAMGVTAGPGCTNSGNSAICPAAGIIGITASAGDQADSVRNDTSTPSTLSGGDGNDWLEGGFGDDILRGNRGLDTHSGDAGDDFIDSRGDKGDVVACGLGNDLARADEPDSVAADCETISRDVQPPSSGAPGRAPGGSGSPQPSGLASRPSPSAAKLLGTGELSKLKPGACAKDIRGTPGDDDLDGTPFGDALFGMQGSDVLDGLGGDDCIFGGLGSDRLFGGQGDDRLVGDGRKKRAGGNDYLEGNAGDDLLSGGSGKDTLAGGEGNDRLLGYNGNDRLSGGPGDDRLKGGRGRNRLSGGAGNDRLNGANRRFDRLDCGAGQDVARADRVDRVRGCERVRRR